MASIQIDAINSDLHKLLQDLELLQNVQNELDESKLSDIQKYSDFKRTKQMEWIEHVPTEFYSRICSSCARVCYEDWVCVNSVSGLLVSTVVHSVINFVGNVLQAALGAPGCDKCKCSRFLHYDDTTKPVKKTKTIENILHDVKAAHHRSNESGGLSDDIAALNVALDAKEAAIKMCCEKLKKVSPKDDLKKDLESVSAVMQKRANKLKSTTARKNADGRIRRIKTFF